MPSLKDQILGAVDVKTTPVAVPEWGLETGLFIRELSAADLDRFELWIMSNHKDGAMQPTAGNLRARLVQMALSDERGNLIFKPEEIAKLGEKSGAVIDRLYQKTRAFNGMDQAEAEKN